MSNGNGENQHYFSAQPQTASRPVRFAAVVRGFHFCLASDRGIFSHGEIDEGSRQLAETMELPPQGEVLDLGCGYGILGVVAAKASPAAHVTLVDVNERAVRLAKENLRRNSIANAEVVQGDAPVALAEREFDAIICNPPIRAGRQQMLRLIEDAAQRLRNDGTLWLVVRTDKGAKRLAQEIAAWFDQVQTVARKGGYRVLRCDK